MPLARLDLDEDPIAEARRAIARGARGIKLHPRAQAFTVDDERLEPVFALAEEERLPVLIHAGRGMPPIGAHLAAVAQRHPGAILILAHAAIVDQERIADLTAGHANVFFDTSTWSVFDILALLARVAPEQVLFATDVPYGNHLSALTLIAAVLEQIGASEAIRRGVMGETLRGDPARRAAGPLLAARASGRRAVAGQPAAGGLPVVVDPHALAATARRHRHARARGRRVRGRPGA